MTTPKWDWTPRPDRRPVLPGLTRSHQTPQQRAAASRMRKERYEKEGKRNG